MGKDFPTGCDVKGCTRDVVRVYWCACHWECVGDVLRDAIMGELENRQPSPKLHDLLARARAKVYAGT